MTRLLIAALLVLLGAVPAWAGAGPTFCTTTLSNKTIDGGLIVPAGKVCELDGVTVLGNVHVGIGATFFAQVSASGTTIILGGVIADNCGFVAWAPAVYVSGNVEAAGCAGTSPVGISGATIGGSFLCLANPAGCAISTSTVGGNVQVNDNANAVVRDDNIGGNLQCLGNSASGLTVTGNNVAGAKEGQCAASSTGSQ
jgi:hypothetical protein